MDPLIYLCKKYLYISIPEILRAKLANSLQLPIIDALSKYYDSKEI